MRSRIRNVWARSNEHIRVRRGQPPHGSKAGMPAGVVFILLLVAGYICWVAIRAMIAMLECLFGLLTAMLPWIALAGVCAVIVYAIIRRPGTLKKR